MGNGFGCGSCTYGAPVERLARIDQVVHRPDGLLNRRVAIGSMAVQQVDVVELQTLERGFRALNQVLAGQAAVVDRVVAEGAAPVDLGRDDQVVALPAEFFDGVAHHDLGLAACVGLGAVEEVDARVVGRFHAVEGDLVADVAAVGDPDFGG